MNGSRKIINPESTGLNSFLTKMYGFMAAAVAVSALTAYLIATRYSVAVMTFMATHHGAIWLLIIAQFAMVFLFRANQNPAVSIVGLFGFAILEGLFFSTLLGVYTAHDITMAFVSAAIVFVVLVVMGLTTKRDLAGIGRQAMAALIALIIVSLINMFLQSAMIQYVFSYIGIIIFSIFTMYDSQRMVQMYYNYGSQVDTTSLAIMGAFNLYLDFINIFLELLNIFGFSSNNRR